MNDNDVEIAEEEQLAEKCRKIISDEEAKLLVPIIQDFLHGMNGLQENQYLEYLCVKFKEYLPEKDDAKIEKYVEEIISEVNKNNCCLKSLEKAHERGITTEYWFASEVQKSVSSLSMQEQVAYFNSLDQAIINSNTQLYNTITTQSGHISMNPNLDGFIAERYHVQTFNLNATANGSGLHAEVVEHVGEGFTKNGFDIVVKDANGNRIQQYQTKYGATAKDTIKLLKSGNYNNQRFLVPEEQVAEVQSAFPDKTVTSTINAGGVQSNPLSKEHGKKLQSNAQNKLGNPEISYNDITNKQFLMGCAKQIGNATVMGAVLGAGMDIVTKAVNGEEIKTEDVVKTAITTGADSGVKVGVASAIKIGAEKGIIKAIPPSTPAGVIANLAFVAVENVKIISKVASGEMTGKEGLSAMMDVTTSAAVGFKSASLAGKAGMAVGSILGPVGVVVGGVVGGTVGYMAGSAVGKAISKGVKSIGTAAKTVVKTVGTAIFDTGRRIYEGAKSAVRSVANSVRSFFGRW